MSVLVFSLVLFAICVLAGVLGSLLGIGGGLVVVPVLTLLFHVDIRLAIGASIVSVIATSSGAAAAYVRERITNLRIGMFLEIATTTGAITGAYIAGLVSGRVLYVLFGVILGYSSLQMFRKRHGHPPLEVSTDKWANSLVLHSSYYDVAEGKEIPYKVTNTKVGLVLMYVAGAVSGLLGIGSGALKVPAMDLAMRLPMKVSSATSNFMIGVTAAASAGVYFARGDIDPYIAAPVASGVLIGALVGSKLLPKLRAESVRLLFVVVLLIISIQMLYKGIL
ncbi:MAG: sulfite exporter TauE/SafE family protein [Acidimicrobiaceae bacterium]|nr:sulfite exporter TauE/SafE family protein [Acidimicrobiaceae bacterium]